MMALAAIAIIVPSVFATVAGGKFVAQSVSFSVVVSIVLLVVYLLGLVFTLGTHAHLFRGDATHDAAGAAAGEGSGARRRARGRHGTPWSLSLAIGVMAVVTLLIVWMSEILVATVEHAAKALGLTNLFVGVVVVAVVGNAAEHSTAILVAMRNRMELAIGIAIGSSTQIALFVAPLLVLLSLVDGAGTAQPRLHWGGGVPGADGDLRRLDPDRRRQVDLVHRRPAHRSLSGDGHHGVRDPGLSATSDATRPGGAAARPACDCARHARP